MYKICRVDIKRSKEVIKRLELYIKDVIKKLNPCCIILFGSFAKDDFNEASDIDLAVVAEFKEEFLERIKRLMDLNNRYKLPLEPIGYTPREFEEMRKRKNLFVEELIKKGKVLYGHIEFGR